MAINKLTVAQPARGDTTAAVITWQAVDTATGCYIDASALKAGNLVILVERDSKASAGSVVIKTGSRFLTNSRGNLTVTLSSHATNDRKAIVIEPSRHINSSGDIVITTTGSTRTEKVAAILLP